MRSALYVDGFNLYHPICELGKNHLKWLNLWKLGERISQDRGHELVSVTYCTAYRENGTDERSRHKKYISALDAVGVKTVLGHYMISKSKPCQDCGSHSEYPTEKQTDINVALSLFTDAMDDQYDVAYLLSADSDQAATANYFKKSFQNKKLITVAPPNKPISKKVLNFADGKRRLNEIDIEQCRFPDVLRGPGGKLIRCPHEYALTKY